MAAQPEDKSTAMVHFKYKTEVSRPVSFIGDKDDLCNGCTATLSGERRHVGCKLLISRIIIINTLLKKIED